MKIKKNYLGVKLLPKYNCFQKHKSNTQHNFLKLFKTVNPLDIKKMPTGMLSLKVPTKTLCFISKDQIHPISAGEQVAANSFIDAVGAMLGVLVSSGG